VLEGTSLTIMEVDQDDMLAAGREALRKALLRSGTIDPAVAFVFSCALRSCILGERTEQEITDMQELVPGVPVVGFYSFGEQGLSDDGVNRHNNEVITVLVLGRELSFASQVALENERLRESLRRSESRFRTLFDSAGDAIFIHDLDGRFLQVNPMASERLGYSREELLQMTPVDIDAPEYGELVPRRIEELRQCESVLFETAHVRRDGTVIPIELSSRIIEYEEQPVVLSIARDITERKRAAEELQKAHDDLETRVKERTTELERANRELQMQIVERKRAEEALRLSVEQTTRGQRLLLALSQAAQAVQRALSPDEIYHIVGEQVVALGYHATIFTLADDRTHLIVSYLTHDSALLRAAERLTGLSAQGYRFPLTPGGFYHQIAVDRKTVFTEDNERPAVEVLPRSVRPLAGRLAGLFDWEQSIVAPLTVDGEVYGLLAVTGDGLRESDVPAVTAFANQAAIAIENARLLDAVTQQGKDLYRLSTQLFDAQEAERRRISRELHDELGQALTAVSINLAAIQHELSRERASLIGERLAETRMLADQALEQIRELSLDLRPTMLDDLGLVPTVEWYADRYARRLSVQVELEVVGLEKRLAPELETALYRVVQEAMTNVARHARATKVRLRLERRAATILALIEDDGQGFDEREVADRAAPEYGVGLLGMRERVAFLGGSLDLQSRPRQGTRLYIELPLRWRDGA
jgi:PAS domain S-box-containing protein